MIRGRSILVPDPFQPDKRCGSDPVAAKQMKHDVYTVLSHRESIHVREHDRMVKAVLFVKTTIFIFFQITELSMDFPFFFFFFFF